MNDRDKYRVYRIRGTGETITPQEIIDDVNVMLYATKGDINAARITLTWSAKHMEVTTVLFDHLRAERREKGEDEWREARDDAEISAWKCRVEARYGKEVAGGMPRLPGTR